jgi:acyl-CoA thioesterase-1
MVQKALLVFLFACLPQLVLASNLLVFGDSLSAGYGLPTGKSWVDMLSKRLSKTHIRVINASISGETTSGGLSRIGRALEQFRPEIVILELGANDGLQGEPVSMTKENLNAIVDACEKHDARVLLVGMRLPPNYGQRYASEFGAIYPEIAKRRRLGFVPFMLEGFAQNLDDFQADGLHPNARAQGKVLANIWKGLSPMLQKQH